MILAELDLGQVFIIVIAMVVGFIQWLVKLIQQNRLERERRASQPMDPEERRHREEIWQEQIKEIAPIPQAPPPVNDPWGSMREVFERVKEEIRPAHPPAPSSPARREEPLGIPTQRPSKPAVRVAQSAASPSVKNPRPVVPKAPQEPPAADPWCDLLRQPGALKQAIVLREVFGPPKALQSSGDAPF